MRPLKIFLIECARWVYWYPVRILLQTLPLRFGYMCSTLVSYPAVAIQKRKAMLIDRGLDSLFGDKITPQQRHTLVRETLENVFKRAIEVLWYPKLTPARCDKMFEYEGLEHVEAAQKEGRGVMLMHGHLGNCQMLMPGMGHKGYKLHQVASRNPPEKFPGAIMAIPNWIRRRAYDIKLSYKETLPAHYLYTDGSMRKVLTSLKENGMLAAAVDGREGAQWIETDFLKQRALFLTGTLNLVRMVRPVVLPTFVVRQKDDRHKLIIHPPMEFEFTDNKEEDIVRNTRKFLALFEEYVEQYPTQYADVYWLEDKLFVAPEEAMARNNGEARAVSVNEETA